MSDKIHIGYSGIYIKTNFEKGYNYFLIISIVIQAFS